MDRDDEQRTQEDTSVKSASRKYKKRKTGENKLLVASKSDEDEDFQTSTSITTKPRDNNDPVERGNPETNADIQNIRNHEKDKEASRIRAKKNRVRHKKAFQELKEENVRLKTQNQILTKLVNLQQIEISTLEGANQRLFFRDVTTAGRSQVSTTQNADLLDQSAISNISAALLERVDGSVLNTDNQDSLASTGTPASLPTLLGLTPPLTDVGAMAAARNLTDNSTARYLLRGQALRCADVLQHSHVPGDSCPPAAAGHRHDVFAALHRAPDTTNQQEQEQEGSLLATAASLALGSISSRPAAMMDIEGGGGSGGGGSGGGGTDATGARPSQSDLFSTSITLGGIPAVFDAGRRFAPPAPPAPPVSEDMMRPLPISTTDMFLLNALRSEQVVQQEQQRIDQARLNQHLLAAVTGEVSASTSYEGEGTTSTTNLPAGGGHQ